MMKIMNKEKQNELADFLDWAKEYTNNKLDYGSGYLAQQYIKKHPNKAENLPISDVSARLSSSLGECVEGNDYEIVADKDGRFWINHKEVGSGEPLTQWIDSVLNVR